GCMVERAPPGLQRSRPVRVGTQFVTGPGHNRAQWRAQELPIFWHPPCFSAGPTAKISPPGPGERLMVSVLPVLLVLLAPSPSHTAASAEEELGFGIEVARRGLWSEARFRFERAVALDPSNAQALNDLAVALEQQGEFAKAREAFDRALKLKPGKRYIQQNYDLFREADDKRNRKKKTPNAAPTPAPTPSPTP